MSLNVDNKIVLGYRQWLDCLLDPANKLYIDNLNLTRVSSTWNLSDRILPYHYMTLVVSSSNHVASRNFVKDIGPGGFLWLNPYEPHSMHPSVKIRPHQFYHLRFSLNHNNCPVILDSPLLFLPDATDLKETFRALLDTFQQKKRIYSEYLIRTKLATLVCEVFEKNEQSEKNELTLSLNQRRIIYNLHEAAAPGTLTPAMIAREVRLTPDYFSRVFKNTYGYSPRTWLTMERMHKAAELLTESNLSISEIARTVNYDDIYVFSKLFKKYYGCSPKHYRSGF